MALARIAPLDADVLLAHALGITKEDLYAHPEAPVDAERDAVFRGLLERRASGEPVAYLRGFKDFYGLRFAVDPRVLIPRPETETLVDAVLASGARLVADIGTGSGAIAVALAVHSPEVRVIATDISADALAVARENAAAHGVADRIDFRQGPRCPNGGQFFKTRRDQRFCDKRCRELASYHRRWLIPALVTLVLLAIVPISILMLRRNKTTPPPAASGKFTQLTDFGGSEEQPSLSPDGQFLAYTAPSATNSSDRDIFLLRVGGRNPINLTKGIEERDTQPAFSPDGQWIAFRSERSGGGVFVMGATGESVRRLTDFGFNPSWSPDGKRIVVSTETSLFL